MRRINIRELLEKTGATSQPKGTWSLIPRRGVPIAETGPSGAGGSRRMLPDRGALLARFPEVSGDSGRFFEEERS